MNNRLKVAMICHFSNAGVREHLPLDNRVLYNIIRKILRQPAKGKGYGDQASWCTNLIDNLQGRDDIELFVISAHQGLKKTTKFDINGVHYSFVNCDYANLLKRIIRNPKWWHKMNPVRPVVRHIIRNIKPDIIALIGAENSYISGSIVGIKDIPIILKCQTIYNNPNRSKYGEVDPFNAYVEKLIFDELHYVSVTTKMHSKLFREYNKNAYNFKWSLGTTYPETQPVEHKEYDFVNFAMIMSGKKGFPDAIKALSIVKKNYPEVKLNLIGGGTAAEKAELIDLVKSLSLDNNVVFTPFFPTQQGLFQHIRKSRFALLPYKLDYISSTTYQAMHYGLPVICYKTEGTPNLNIGEERVLIAELGDVEDLAQKMLYLLDNPDKAELLSNIVLDYSNQRNNGKQMADQIISDFKAIIDNYRNGTAIPEKLLFDESL